MARNFKLTAIILSLLLVLLLSPSVLAANCGGGTACQCGDTLTSSRTFTASDYTSTCSGTFGLVIGASDIELDCNQEVISRSSVGGIGIYSNDKGGVTIQNCVIDGWNSSMTFSSATSNIDNSIIKHNTIQNGGYLGMVVANGSSSGTANNMTIYNNTVKNIGGHDSVFAYQFRLNGNSNVSSNTAINISTAAYSGAVGFYILGLGTSSIFESNSIDNINSLDPIIGVQLQGSGAVNNNIDCKGVSLNQDSGKGTGIGATNILGVIVQNCNLDGWNSSIRLTAGTSDIDNSVVKNNNVSNSGVEGIFVAYTTGGGSADNVTIYNNRVVNSGQGYGSGVYGIELGLNKSNISFNTVINMSADLSSGTAYGMTIVGHDSTISNNVVTDMNGFLTLGIVALAGARINITNNNVSDGEYGISNYIFYDYNGLPPAQDLIIKGNIVSSMSAVGIYSQGNVTAIDDNVVSGGQYSIISGKSYGESISGNTLSGATNTAIYLTNSQGANVLSNTITSAVTGIGIQNSNTANISGLTLTGGCCSGTPIAITSSNNTLIENVNLYNLASPGITLAQSSQSTSITGLTVQNSTSSAISITSSGATTMSGSSMTNVSGSAVSVTSSTSLTVSTSTFNAVGLPAYGWLGSYSPFELNGVLYTSQMSYSDIFGSEKTVVTSDDTAIPSADDGYHYDFIIGENLFGNTGNGTHLLHSNDGVVPLKNCGDVGPLLEPGETCDAFIDEALTYVDATSDFGNTNFTNALNATFKVTSGGTTPMTLTYGPLTPPPLIASTSTPTTYAGSNSKVNTNALVIEPAASTNTVTETIAVSGSKPSFTLTTGSSTMVASNSYGRINWTGSITADTTLKGNVVIDRDVIAVRSTSLPMLNTTANVTLEGIDCSDFNLFYDGSGSLTAASIRLNGAVVATDANIGGDCTDTGVCQDVACSGTTLTFEAQHFSGYSVGGNSQLTINDSAEGSTAASGSEVTFYAYYQNLTGDHIAGADCNITLDGLVTDASMTEQGSYYDYTYAYSTQGTKNWNVTCNGASHDDLSATDTLSVSAAVPEWSDLVYVLLLGGLIGLFVVNRKREE